MIPLSLYFFLSFCVLFSYGCFVIPFIVVLHIKVYDELYVIPFYLHFLCGGGIVMLCTFMLAPITIIVTILTTHNIEIP
jgi:hypothetical protein